MVIHGQDVSLSDIGVWLLRMHDDTPLTEDSLVGELQKAHTKARRAHCQDGVYIPQVLSPVGKVKLLRAFQSYGVDRFSDFYAVMIDCAYQSWVKERLVPSYEAASAKNRIPDESCEWPSEKKMPKPILFPLALFADEFHVYAGVVKPTTTLPA